MESRDAVINALLDILYNGDYYLDINGKSKHLGTDVKYNEDNHGFGITAEKDGKFLTAGKYNNSFNDPSYYAGGGLKKKYGNKDFYIEPGIMGGIVSGYEDKITPMILPMITAGLYDYGALNLMYAPEVKDKNPATLMLNYSIPFK
jgi:hypothetical protein